MTDAEEFKREWDRNGFFVVPSLLDSSGVEELKVICDDVLNQWIDSSHDPQQSANSTNMAFLTEPRYFEKNPQGLRTLLGAIGDHRILAIVRAIIGSKPLFHNTQYFFNPASETWSGDWHRDQQFGAVSIEEEKLRMARTAGVHVHIAFLPDDNLEIVPGTHNRWDTPEDWRFEETTYGTQLLCQTRIGFGWLRVTGAFLAPGVSIVETTLPEFHDERWILFMERNPAGSFLRPRAF